MKMRRFAVQVTDTWGFSEYWVKAQNKEEAEEFVRRQYREIQGISVVDLDSNESKRSVWPSHVLPQVANSDDTEASFLLTNSDVRKVLIEMPTVPVHDAIQEKLQSFDPEAAAQQPAKKKRGRPAGSKNKPKTEAGGTTKKNKLEIPNIVGD